MSIGNLNPKVIEKMRARGAKTTINAEAISYAYGSCIEIPASPRIFIDGKTYRMVWMECHDKPNDEILFTLEDDEPEHLKCDKCLNYRTINCKCETPLFR